jgi:hypothetical protein
MSKPLIVCQKWTLIVTKMAYFVNNLKFFLTGMNIVYI